jgi:hypothetical protein
MAYGCDNPHTNWHKDLGPGIALAQNAASVATQRTLFDNIEDYGQSGVTFGRDTDRNLASIVPSLPVTYSDFLVFLMRYQLILQKWLTVHCALFTLVKDLRSHVMATTRHIMMRDEWYRRTGPFIIWQLVLIAKDFFRQTRTRDSYPFKGCVKIDQTAALVVQIALASSTNLDELPPMLQATVRHGTPLHLYPLWHHHSSLPLPVQPQLWLLHLPNRVDHLQQEHLFKTSSTPPQAESSYNSLLPSNKMLASMAITSAAQKFFATYS